MRILFLLFTLPAFAHSPPYPRGARPVCFEVCDINLANCEKLHAVAINGMVEDLKIPEGKFVTRECPKVIAP